MLNNFEKFSFPSIEKRWTKDKETDGQKEKQIKRKNKIGHSSRSSSIQRSKTTVDQRCLVMFHNFGKFSFLSIKKRWTKDKHTDTQKEK